MAVFFAVIIKATLATQAPSSAQCPVCADVPEDPVVGICGHVYCQQCAAAQLEGAGVSPMAKGNRQKQEFLECVGTRWIMKPSATSVPLFFVASPHLIRLPRNCCEGTVVTSLALAFISTVHSASKDHFWPSPVAPGTGTNSPPQCHKRSLSVPRLWHRARA
eukprot:1139111-Pelagomonas_calceolata.AAC.1